MTAVPPESSSSSDPTLDAEAAKALLQSLRRKEGTWVQWGQACQTLQKAGFAPQKIFEETGFEPIQQNQIIVAAQVYSSIAQSATPELLARFERTGSDTLYEFRILAQPDRVAAATIVFEKGIDSEGSREVAKALKEFSRLSKPPEGFSDHPGDAVAHYYWKLARQQSDLQMRSRLIALALRFVQTEPARQQVEKLLTDFTVARSRSAPRLPFYRLESAEEQPYMLAVAGQLPLTAADLRAVPLIESEGTFQIVKTTGASAWVALPAWQVLRNAEDAVAILAESSQLPAASDNPEEVLVVVDRAQRQWDAESYFVFEQAEQIQIDWFEEAPATPLLGRVILVVRPKRVLDEDFNQQLWQLDE